MRKAKILPIGLIGIAAVAGAGIAGLATYARQNPQPAPTIKDEAPITAPSVPTRQNSNQTEPEKPKQTVKTLQKTADGYKLGPSVRVPGGASAEVAALNENFKQQGYKEARALSFSVSDGLATVELNAAILGGMASEEEADFVRLIQTTMSQFPEVKYVELKVDGRKVDSLGHLELENPIKVNQD